MQKIVVGNSPNECKSIFGSLICILKNKCKEFLILLMYLGTLSAVAYTCYSHLPPLVVFQVLFAWLIIFNTVFLVFGTPPLINFFYFKEANGEVRFYPPLSGSVRKYSLLLVTVLFVSTISAIIMTKEFAGISDFLLFEANLFTLSLSIYFWYELILLLHSVHRYGQQSLGTSEPYHYVQHEQYNKDKIPLSLILLLLCCIFFLYGTSKFSSMEEIISLYILSCILWTTGRESTAGIKGIIFVVLFTILLLSYKDATYVPFNFFLLLTILFVYLIMLWSKEILRRESHVYLSNEVTCDALKSDVKNYIQTFAKGVRRTQQIASYLYFIFIIILFSVILKLDYARQFSKMFGLEYFYKSIVN